MHIKISVDTDKSKYKWTLKDYNEVVEALQELQEQIEHDKINLIYERVH